MKDVGPTNSWLVGPVQATRSYRIILLTKERGEFLNQSGSQVRPCRDAGPSRWASAISQTEGLHSGGAVGLGVKGSLERAGCRPVRTRAGPALQWLTFNGGGPTVFNICIFSLGIFRSNLQLMQTSYMRASGAGLWTGKACSPHSLQLGPFFLLCYKRRSLKIRPGSMALPANTAALSPGTPPTPSFTATVLPRAPGSVSNPG